MSIVLILWPSSVPGCAVLRRTILGLFVLLITNTLEYSGDNAGPITNFHISLATACPVNNSNCLCLTTHGNSTYMCFNFHIDDGGHFCIIGPRRTFPLSSPSIRGQRWARPLTRLPPKSHQALRGPSLSYSAPPPAPALSTGLCLQPPPLPSRVLPMLLSCHCIHVLWGGKPSPTSHMRLAVYWSPQSQLLGL